MLRAQKAEEERANYQAAMQNLQQRNQYLQQQQEEQRLADIERHRKQHLQEEQAQRAAQARCASYSVVVELILGTVYTSLFVNLLPLLGLSDMWSLELLPHALWHN